MKTFLIACIVIPMIGAGQDFKKSIDKINNIQVVTFEDLRLPVRIPIIVKKITSLDSSSSSSIYHIGLYVIINLLPIEFFMQKGGAIVFEDGTKMKLGEEISKTFLSGGKHQIAIDHKLTMPELKQLQEKNIDYFLIGNVESNMDRFERSDVKDIFLKIEKE